MVILFRAGRLPNTIHIDGVRLCSGSQQQHRANNANYILANVSMNQSSTCIQQL